MKKQLLFLALPLALLMSCDKDDDAQAAPTPFEIKRADAEPFYKPNGTLRTFFAVNVATTPMPLPRAGENQVWDFSNLPEQSSFSTTALLAPPANPSFATATYAYPDQFTTGLGAALVQAPATNFWELNNNGLFQLGVRINGDAVLNLPPSLPGTVTFPAQNVPGENGSKRTFMNFPGRYNDSIRSALVWNQNMVVNVPVAGLNNVPGNMRSSYVYQGKIIASGTVKLKGIGERRALVSYERSTRSDRYLLGGQLAPANLLAMLGLSQDQSFVSHSYDVWAEGLGVVASYDANDANTATVSFNAMKQ